jgi:cell division protein FtsB
MNEQSWLMRVTTILAAFCAFILADIYKDFKQLRDDVVAHKYQIHNMTQDVEQLKRQYYISASDRTYIKSKIR